METFIDALRWLHITAGFIALLTGGYNLVARKGGKRHVLVGRVFYGSMLTVAYTAIGISVSTGNTFLLCVGLFAFFMNHSGFRSARNRSLKPDLIDWLILGTGLANGAFMLWTGDLILMVFGGISTFLALLDVRTFIQVLRKQPIPKMQWLTRHIGMMVGTYIATFTAFLVVNIDLPGYGWIVWLSPTIVLTPLIVFWTRKYRKG